MPKVKIGIVAVSRDWVEAHKGYRKYIAIAGKCWPAFQTQFGFVL